MDKCRDKICPSGKICNPATGRCVDSKGKIGKNIRRKSPSPKRKSPSPKRKSPKRKSPVSKCKNVVCASTKICNPSSGRCVDRNGKIGKMLLGNKKKSPERKSPVAEPIREVIPVFAEEKKSGKDEAREINRERIGKIPDEYKLTPAKSCSIPNDKIDRIGTRTYKLYSLDDLYRNLLNCGRDRDAERYRIEINNKLTIVYNSILTNILNITNFAYKKYYLLRNSEYNLLLTPQLKGKDFDEYAQVVDKFVTELNDREKTQHNFTELLRVSLKHPNYIGIMYYLYSLSTAEYSRVIWNYIESYKLLYTIMIDLLKNSYTPEFYNKVKESGNPRQFTIKAGTLFYRGVSRLQNIDSIRPKFWIAYDLRNAYQYIIPSNKYLRDLANFCKGTGGVAVYRLTRDIVLPNMENAETVKEIGSRIKDKNLKRIYDIAFRVVGNIVVRKSYMREDALIVDWMCANGISGFTANNFRNTFWAELFICNPTDLIEYVGYYDLEDLGYNFCNSKYTKYNINIS